MADKNQIVLELNAKATKLLAEVKKVKKELDKLEGQTKKNEKANHGLRISTSGIRRSLGAMRNNLLLVSFALGGSVAAIGKLITKTKEQELAEKKLSAALGFTSHALLDQATALQQQTAFGDEAIIGVQALIGMFTKDEEKIKELTKATLDLSAAKGMDLTAAADLVSKSFGSATNALSRYGITVEGAVGSTERLEMLTGNVANLFGGQAVAQADTLSGSLDQMHNALGDTAETMGTLASPATIAFSKSIKGAAEGLSEFFTELKETELETAVRQLRELGVESEKLKKLTDTVRMQNFTEEMMGTLQLTSGLIQGMQQHYLTFSAVLSDSQLEQMGFLETIDVHGRSIVDAHNLQFVTSEKINKVLDQQLLKAFDLIDGKTTLTEQEQEQVEELDAQRELIIKILQATVKREQLEQNILDIRNNTPPPVDTLGPGDTGDLFKDFEAFKILQDEKLDKYNKEQDMIAMLVEQYPALADSLGLVTDARKKELETTEALEKARNKEGMQFLKNIKSATKGQEKYALIFKTAAITETTITTAQAMMSAYKAMAGIPIFGPALGVAAASAAGAAGAVQISEIAQAQYGMNEIVDQPTLILAGEAGAEQVSITPLESPNIGGVQGGGSLTVNVSGNVLTSDFVEGELAEAIRESVRRGTDFGIG